MSIPSSINFLTRSVVMLIDLSDISEPINLQPCRKLAIAELPEPRNGSQTK